MKYINCFITCIALVLTSFHPAHSSEPDNVVPMNDFTHLFTPKTSEQELSMQEQNLANQARQQEHLWQSGVISRYQYFTTVARWEMARFALSRQKTPHQPLSEEQLELARKIIENFQTRIDTLTRLAAAGQAEEADFIILKLNQLIFERDLAIAVGSTKDTIIQKQKNIIAQINVWLEFVQKAVEHHVMGLSDLQIPKTTMEKAQKRLNQLETTLPQ